MPCPCLNHYWFWRPLLAVCFIQSFVIIIAHKAVAPIYFALYNALCIRALTYPVQREAQVLGSYFCGEKNEVPKRDNSMPVSIQQVIWTPFPESGICSGLFLQIWCKNLRRILFWDNTSPGGQIDQQAPVSQAPAPRPFEITALHWKAV